MAYLIAMFRRPALYGMIAFLVALFGKKVNISTLLELSQFNSGFESFIASFLLLSGMIWVGIEILFVIYRKLLHKFSDGSDYGVFDFFITIFRDITHPFLSFGTLMHGLFDKDFISTSMGWAETIFGFVWTFGWIGLLVVGVFIL